MDKVTGRQISAARALCGISQAQLATAAGISVPTLKRMEASDGEAVGLRNNVGAVKAALEATGVVFIAENGGGAGVRLLKPSNTSDHPEPVGPATDALKRMEDDIHEDRQRPKRKPKS